MSHEISIITGKTETEVWEKLSADLKKNDGLLEYSAVINHNDRKIMFIVDIDPGGGFEGGYAFTTFSAPFLNNNEFKFAIHKEGLLAELGKFFGLQDVVIGYPEFDNKVIVKTNNEKQVKTVFEDSEIRKVFQTMDEYRFEITHHYNPEKKEDEQYLELVIEKGISDANILQPIYHAFFKVLLDVDKQQH